MSSSQNTSGEPARDPPPPELPRVRRALVVADMVESVRLMRHHEASVIRRWRQFVGAVRSGVLVRHEGRLVKSLGDGLLLEFTRVDGAVAAALDLQHCAELLNEGVDSSESVWLRVGVHVADVQIDDLDIYGIGVNLAARLTTLAAAGEVVVSVDVRDELIPDVDPDVADLGECYVKHLEEPIRAFRLLEHAAGGLPAEPRADAPKHLLPNDSLAPLLAVVPLHAGAGVDPKLARVVSDDLTAALGRCVMVRIVSRLSTLTLGSRPGATAQAARWLRADHALHGTLDRSDDTFVARLVLVDVRADVVLWEGRLPVPSVLEHGDLAQQSAQVAGEVVRALTSHQVVLEHVLALPNLPAYALLLSAMTHLHRLAETDFREARALLDHLVDRHPRSADARAWLAKWHFLQVSQAKSSNPARDIAQARRHIAVALQNEPAHALCAALDAHLTAFVDRRLPAAQALLQQVVERSSNEPMAWLFLSNVLACVGRGAEAARAVERASSLSPLDPMRYFFDLFAARAYSTAGDLDQAVFFARRSVQANGLHLSSLIELIINLMLAGHQDEARQWGLRYLALRPDASVQRFVDHHLCTDKTIVCRDADALLEAGLPP